MTVAFGDRGYLLDRTVAGPQLTNQAREFCVAMRPRSYGKGRRQNDLRAWRFHTGR